MKKLISLKIAGNILLVAIAALFVFHILVLVKIVPASIVWGGQAQGSIVVLELIALVITLLFAAIIAAKTGYLAVGKFKLIVNIGIWLIVAFLLLNTLGNLASGVSFENLIFAPITLILAFLALRLAIEK